MKKNFFIILILVFGLASVSAQSCLPDGIFFTSQSQLDSFQILYPNCSEIEGTVTIEGNDISSLNALSVLTSVGGGLWIHNNTNLASLSGLENLNFVGESLSFIGNSTLGSLEGLENLTTIGSFVYIKSNDALGSLAGLDNLTEVGGDLSIVSNDDLVNLNELGNLTSVMGRIFIGGNMSLESLSGLESINSIPGELRIMENQSLSNLTGLDNLGQIGEHILIWHNDSLTSLAALEGVISIGGWLTIVDNDALTSLTGLGNIESGSIETLVISGNYALSTCEVLSVCEYLAIPGDSIAIYNNAPGCNNREEVEDACIWIGLDENYQEVEINIFPNPATHTLTIHAHNRTVEEVRVYNHTGQLVLEQKPEDNVIEVSALRSGMYILEVKIDNIRLHRKFYIQR